MKTKIITILIAAVVSTVIIGLTSGHWIKGFIYSLLLTSVITCINTFANKKKKALVKYNSKVHIAVDL